MDRLDDRVGLIGEKGERARRRGFFTAPRACHGVDMPAKKARPCLSPIAKQREAFLGFVLIFAEGSPWHERGF